jgi:hypothetical protein
MAMHHRDATINLSKLSSTINRGEISILLIFHAKEFCPNDQAKITVAASSFQKHNNHRPHLTPNSGVHVGIEQVLSGIV